MYMCISLVWSVTPCTGWGPVGTARIVRGSLSCWFVHVPRALSLSSKHCQRTTPLSSPYLSLSGKVAGLLSEHGAVRPERCDVTSSSMTDRHTMCYLTLCYLTLCYLTLCYLTLCYLTLCNLTLCYRGLTLCYLTLCYRGLTLSVSEATLCVSEATRLSAVYSTNWHRTLKIDTEVDRHTLCVQIC